MRELIYQELLDHADKGYEMVQLGQSDGFRPCECAECANLYGVKDFGEKLWIMHREMAERFLKDRPGKKLCIMAYGFAILPNLVLLIGTALVAAGSDGQMQPSAHVWQSVMEYTLTGWAFLFMAIPLLMGRIPACKRKSGWNCASVPATGDGRWRSIGRQSWRW